MITKVLLGNYVAIYTVFGADLFRRNVSAQTARKSQL